MATQVDSATRNLSWMMSDECDDHCSSGAVLVDIGQQHRTLLLVRPKPKVLFRANPPQPRDSPEVAEDFVNRYLQRSNVSTPDSVPGLCPQDPCFVPRSFELAPNCEKCLYSTANPPIHKNVHRQIANASLYIASSGSKSANIAIKRSRQDINSIVDSSMERMYECATWRMYHRITSSRRAKTSVVNLDRNNKHSNPTENQFDFGTSLMDEPLQMDANQRLDDYAQPKSPSDFNLDGEVFTLDI